jgi:alkylation response protein AidB-like acyl-CoA dehydrogenase
VGGQLGTRVVAGTRTGYLPPQSGSILKLFNSGTTNRRSDITMELAGAAPVVWKQDDLRSSSRGVGYLSRQAGSILSGTTEIQRNIVSERILDLPREPDPSRELPFNELKHNTIKR